MGARGGARAWVRARGGRRVRGCERGGVGTCVGAYGVALKLGQESFVNTF